VQDQKTKDQGQVEGQQAWHVVPFLGAISDGKEPYDGDVMGIIFLDILGIYQVYDETSCN